MKINLTTADTCYLTKQLTHWLNYMIEKNKHGMDNSYEIFNPQKLTHLPIAIVAGQDSSNLGKYDDMFYINSKNAGQILCLNIVLNPNCECAVYENFSDLKPAEDEDLWLPIAKDYDIKSLAEFYLQEFFRILDKI